MDISGANKWLEQQESNLLEFIIKLANINSGSTHLEGISLVAAEIKKRLNFCKVSSETIKTKAIDIVDLAGNLSTQNNGDIQRYFIRPNAKTKILLVGHLDTVFPKDTNFVKAEIKGNKLHGPGVSDMKGGIAVMLTALEAFEKLEIKDNLGWEIILVPDEEIGSKASYKYLESRAEYFDVAFIYEPALDDIGTFAGARGGSGKFSFCITGVAAHVGREFTKGKSAIVAMAQLCLELNKLNNEHEDLIVNIGNISGGTAVNVVPANSVCHIDVRVASTEAKEHAAKRIAEITTAVADEFGVEIKTVGDFFRPAKQMSLELKNLFKLLEDVAKPLGLTVNTKDTKGCCDGNNLQHKGLVTIDTMGVCGSHIHSDAEYLMIPSLVARSKLSLGMFYYLAQHGISKIK